MFIAEMLPEVRSLSRGDKFKLIRLLAQELERDETEIIEANRDYPIWSPDTAFRRAPRCWKFWPRNNARDRGQ